MEYVAKQTYLYLALEEAIKELTLQHKQKVILKSMMSPFIQSHFKTILDSLDKKQRKQEVPKTHMNASIILDSQFQYGEREHPKLKAVLYGITLPFQQKIDCSKNDVAILQVFGSKNLDKKKRNMKPRIVQNQRAYSQDSAKSKSIAKKIELDEGKRTNCTKLETKGTKKSKIN